jgi:hypothetical protein
MAMNRRYVNFSVGIESAPGGGYRVRASSPQAEAESLTRFEFDLGRLHEALRCRMNAPSAPPRRDLSPPGGPSADLDLAEVGRALFAALFAGAVGELYSAVWSAAQAAKEGLRIRLHLRPQEPELAWLTGIPWEILFDERAGCFPCLNPLNPLVRHLDLPRPVERAPFRRPLRVLVVAASPAGLSALDLKGEQEGMEASRQVRVKVLEGAGPEELRAELLRGGYQAVHFMGHGMSGAAEGSLIFSTPGGEPRGVTGNALAHLVQGVPTLGLALLNACHSAAVPTGSAAASLAGVAGALVRGGVPAVVGMQLAISDRAALTFSRVLYARLAEGEPIEAAVCEARLALYLADSGGRDWVAPVLFLRGSNQRIEEETMKEKPPERDVYRAVYKGDEFEGGEIEVKGEISAERPQGDERPRDSHTEMNIRRVKAQKLSLIGSDQRGSK